MARNSQSGFVHIGKAIEGMLREYHIKGKFDEENVVSSWERLVGKPIARRTRKVYVRNKVIFVELESPSLKNDLKYHKEKILEIFRKEFVADAVGDIVLM